VWFVYNFLFIAAIAFGVIYSIKIFRLKWGKLFLLVNGRMEDVPGGLSEASKHDHIVEGMPRSIYWYKSDKEMLAWLGEGKHTLQFQFRNVKSNILEVEVKKGARIKFKPELELSHWTKER